ncbi:MAG: chromate efflux transporter [Verrucomicrobia bacterium]|nr:chromate efflux transporter [Verrucomicrobiota bacterium]
MKPLRTPAGNAGGVPLQELRHPTFGEAFRFWLKLGFISFGGPTGQIAIMHAELVEKRKWISEARFLHALNYCMLLPGPEAQQLATYIGWLLHKTWGGIAAGAFFILPSIFILWTLSYVYVAFGNLSWIAAIFYGLKPAVLAIVTAAVLRIGTRALNNEVMWTLAAAAFAAIFFFHVPFPLIIVSAAVAGFVGGRRRRDKFLVIRGHGNAGAGSVLDDLSAVPDHARPSLGRALRICVIGVVLWPAPVVLLAFWLGRDHTLVEEGMFFSKAALVTFGGAYAVLPYVAQQAVQTHRWLSAGQMLDGLGLAETTPGPLIMVTQFVGFLGGWNHPGRLAPLLAATLGALVTTWTTFTPCFLWIFLGGPYIEKWRGNEALTTTLSAVTAAVVGVVLNLAVWFGLHVIFPDGGAADWRAILISAVAFTGMVRWKWDIVPVILGAGVAGLIFRMLLIPFR